METPAIEAVAAEIEEALELNEDVDEVSEQLAVHQIISEERHDEIIEGVNICQERLEALSTRLQTLEQNQSGVQQTDSPVLSQILQQVTEIRTRQETLEQNLRSLLDSKPSNPQQSPSVVPNPEPGAVDVDPVAVIEPQPASEPQRRKRRIL